MNRILLIALCISTTALMSTASGDTPPPTHPTKLPGPPSGPNVDDLKNFRLHATDVKDAKGVSVTEVPATLIDILSGMGSWATVSPADAPRLDSIFPDNIRNRVELYSASNDAGWMVVPRGWKVWRAALGADGNTWFDFVAPTGVQNGWMVTGEIPACVGCMLWDTDGLIPGAHQKLIDAGLADPGTEIANVVPKPDSITHPDTCTAIIRYQMPASPPIQAVIYLGHPEPNPSDSIERALYLALPASEDQLGAFIIAKFRKSLPTCGGLN